MAKKKAKKANLFTQFAKIRGNPIAFLFVDYIDLSDVVVFERVIRGKRFTDLDVILQSPGGNPHAAYQLISIARSHASTVHVCVPYFAKSAATLLCLGAESIVLSEAAELGPLDTQVRERESAGKYSWNSALNPSKAIDQLRRYSLETFDLAVKLILERSDLDHDEACDRAIEFVAATTGQLFSKLDPIKIGEYSRALAIGREYGYRLMSRAGVIVDGERHRVLDRIVEGYPSHDFIIDHIELAEMGFRVELMDEKSMKMLPSLFEAVPDLSQFIEVVQP